MSFLILFSVKIFKRTLIYYVFYVRSFAYQTSRSTVYNLVENDEVKIPDNDTPATTANISPRMVTSIQARCVLYVYYKHKTTENIKNFEGVTIKKCCYWLLIVIVQFSFSHDFVSLFGLRLFSRYFVILTYRKLIFFLVNS